jgi:AcrR family transcriptional regulator
MTRRTPPQPRKTPVQARSGATVGVILEAAARILETEGFEGYTTNAIAARAGVSIGSLYQYFPNKDAVTAALVLADAESFLARCKAAADAARDRSPHALMETLIGAVVAHQLDRPALARLIDIEEARLAGDPRTEEIDQELFTLVLGLWAEAGIELPFDPVTSTADVFALVRGIVDMAGLRGETDHAALTARVQHAVRGYLRPVTAS